MPSSNAALDQFSHASQAPDLSEDYFRILTCSGRDGSRHAIGELLERCRQYLALIANRELATHLRPKAGASDLVQETFLEAQQCFDQFSGETEADLLAWLRGILLHNLSDFVRRYEGSEKRRVSRERRLDSACVETPRAVFPAAEAMTPSRWVMRQERIDALRTALARLRDDDRRVLCLRYQSGMTFAEIGRRMHRSPDAVRMLWTRALKRLNCQLDSLDE